MNLYKRLRECIQFYNLYFKLLLKLSISVRTRFILYQLVASIIVIVRVIVTTRRFKTRCLTVIVLLYIIVYSMLKT